MQVNSNQQVASKTNGTSMTTEQMLARIAELEAKVQAKDNRKLTFHISEKTGAVVIRGWNKQFPLTGYLSQLDRLFAQIDELKAFVSKYRAHLAVKTDTWNPTVSLAGVPEDVIARIKEQAS